MNLKTILKYCLILVLILAGAFGGYQIGVGVGEQHPKEVVINNVTNSEAPQGANADFSTFWQAWQLVSGEHLKGDKIASQEKVYGAIRGLLDSLNDPYTDFFNPEESKKFAADIRGNFSGIGAEIGFRKEQLVIISPLKGSPASRAGLQPGDKIMKINDIFTDDLTVDRAVSLIRGDRGTQVILSILRNDWDKPQEFKITRENIEALTLDWEMKPDGIAYVRLYAFNDNSLILFEDAASKIMAQNAKGLILDLRSNPGGYLDTAVDLAGWFLPQNALVVSEEGRDRAKMDELRSSGPSLLEKFPTVVLINGASASASEILAGALRDNRQVKLIGEKSFGKGTVQKLENLSDGSSVKITIAHWVLPSGKILESEGLVPDIEVKISDEDIENKQDPQLDKALEVIKLEIK